MLDIVCENGDVLVTEHRTEVPKEIQIHIITI